MSYADDIVYSLSIKRTKLKEYVEPCPSLSLVYNPFFTSEMNIQVTSQKRLIAQKTVCCMTYRSDLGKIIDFILNFYR
jgi:hypothetical protein